jgi:hypothetical protein
MRTVSEQRFEEYLRNRGFNDFEYEPEIVGLSRHPDYRLSLAGSNIYFEVKEFEPHREIPVGGSYDPYAPIRSKISEAQKQVRALKGQMCAVVLANPHNRSLVHLDSVEICSAMFGNLEIEWPFDAEAGAFDSERAAQVFLSGGKMIRYKNGQPIAPQNTTISAVCVLGYVQEVRRRFRIRVAELRRETWQSRALLSILEQVFQTDGAAGGARRDHLRIQVYENPYAVAPLVDAFGTGPWDERFGVRNSRLLRVFVGSSLAALEVDELSSGVEISDPLGLRRG